MDTGEFQRPQPHPASPVSRCSCGSSNGKAKVSWCVHLFLTCLAQSLHSGTDEICVGVTIPYSRSNHVACNCRIQPLQRSETLAGTVGHPILDATCSFTCCAAIVSQSGDLIKVGQHAIIRPESVSSLPRIDNHSLTQK